ncbi:c-type cytochrome [Primorskyibacter sedentarius]|uniref:Cytochrome c553 n=1 Tax=Primorskyibacter sedentarius TaxID=745311 RepID=A0A4R3JM40_9RHOB|nr:c-type cytochrome [Primorskyibacter sedentarius]TCS67437.1 cytochrome c553 [Primorskyibacter sedentarius]
MKSLIILVCLAASPIAAQEAESGAAHYHQHCATCHGLDADGNGPMAGVLTIKPSDLTALSKGNGGEFPFERVAKRIDGRDPLVAHGSPMPVYGPYFEGGRDVAIGTGSGQPLMTSKPVADLIAYLQELQSADEG